MALYADLLKTSINVGSKTQSGVSTKNNLPVTGNTNGDITYVIDTNKLMVWNNGGWYTIATATNTNPTISSAGAANVTLSTGGTATVITIAASDTETGTALTYAYSVTAGSLTNGGGATATVTQGTGSNTNKFTVTPTTNASYGGTFSLTFTATDGVGTATSSASAFTLQFATYGGMLHNSGNRGLTIAADNDFDMLDGAFTFEWWVWPDPNGNGYGSMWVGAADDYHPNTGFSAFHVNQYMNCRWYVSGSQLATGGFEVYDRTWNHIALVRESNGNTTAYGNGTAITNMIDIDIDTVGSTAALPIYVGWNGKNTSGDCRGYMSNVRFVKGTALYTANFVPSMNLTNVTNTTLLTLNNTSLADASSENNTSKLTLGTNASISTNGFPYAGGIWSSGLQSGFTYTGENLGTDSWTLEMWVSCQTCYYDRALYQHGQDNGSWGIYIKGNTNAASTAKGNIVVYEKAASGTPTQTILATSTYRIWHKDDSSTTLYDPAPANSVEQHWNHVAVTFNDSTNTGQIWIDGKPDTTFTKSTAWTFTNTTCMIAKDNVTGGSGYGTGRVMVGDIQDLRLVKGSTVYAQPGSHVTGNSTYFDGTGDYASVTNNARFSMGTGDFTIEGWIKTYDQNHNEGYFIVGGSAAGGWNSSNYASSISLLRGYGDSGNLGFYGNGNENNLDTAVNPAVGVWFHFAFVRISNTLKIYIDGVQKYSATDNTNYSGTSLILGGCYDVNQVAEFNMSNFRVVKGTGVYTSAFSVPTAPLTDISGTSILCCQTASGTTVDNSSHSQTFTHHGNTTTSTTGPWGYTATLPSDKLTAISGTSLLTARTITTLKPTQAHAIVDESSHNRTITNVGNAQLYQIQTRPWE